jgi:iron transport multicopper oxidase
VVPTLYTALSAPPGNVTDPTIYGIGSNTVVFPNPLGIVEIALNNFDTGSHPFHIHGHVAQIVAQGPPGTSLAPNVFNGTYAPIPARRDVFMVYKNSYTIIRFKTSNPGVWLLHCHIEWHIEAGLVMTFVEDPIQLQQQNLTVPQNMYDACTAQGIPYVGNAGGNSKNWYDLSKAPLKANKNPWG